MAMQTQRAQLPVLFARLLKSRRRLLAVRFLRLVVAALLTGLASLVVLELLRLMQATEFLSAEPRATALLLPAALIGLLALAVGAAVTLPRTPQLADLAIEAERHYRLSERFSTALDVAQRTRLSLIERALLQDAEEHAVMIEPGRLVPLTLPRSVRLLPLPLVLLAALQFVPPLAGTPLAPEGAAHAEQPDQGESAGDESAQVEALARLVEEAAGQAEDPYLEALARSYRDLSERLAAGEVGADQLGTELNQLAEHLERALGEDVAQGLGILETLPPSLAAAQAQMEAREAAAAAAAERAQAAAEARAAQADRPPSDDEFDDIFRQFNFDFTPGSDEQPRGDVPRAPGEVIGNPDYATPDPRFLEEYERRRREAALRAEGQGQVPIGAAEQSNEGAGELAGQGTQPLERGAEGAGDAAGLEREEFELPEGDPRAGRRVQVELPPETLYVAIDDAAPPVNGEWTRSRESVRNDAPVGIINRDVISRYFLPISGDAQADAEGGRIGDESPRPDTSTDGGQ